MALSRIASRTSGQTDQVVGRRAIFFDRDGVLTIPIVKDGRTYAPLRLSEFQIYTRAMEAIERAKDAGFLCVVVTNQPDVASGKTTRAIVDRMHKLLLATLKLDDIEVSFDSSGSNAPRRKPNPGMLTDSAAKWGIDLTRSFVIGDTWKDITAARTAGCHAILVDHHYENEPQPPPSDYQASDVLDAVLWCVRSGKSWNDETH